MPRLVTARRTGVLLVAVIALSACGASTDVRSGTINSDVATVHVAASAYYGTLLDPAMPRPELTLTNTDGRPFSFADRPREEVTVVFFGYTHCPDACPTTMADLAAARRQLPEAVRDRVTVTFVTEDPDRDTPKVLRGWLDGFDPDFVGLRGGNDDTERVLEELYLPASKRIPDPTPAVVHPEDGHEHPGDYGLEHAGIVYAFGPGAATVIYTGGMSPTQYAEDFTELASTQ